MLKVLNVVEGPGWTGGVEQTMLLSRTLRGLGIDAQIATHVKSHLMVEAEKAGIPAYAYQTGSRPGDVWRLRKIVSQGFDVVIGHKPKALMEALLAIMTIAQRPLFLGVRRVSYSVRKMNTYRMADHVIAVSHNIKDVLVECGHSPESITVIQSGVDLKRFEADEAMRQDERTKRNLLDKTVLLNLAKFVPHEKGQDVLFDAIAPLAQARPMKLLIAGIHTDGPLASNMIAERGLEGVVDQVGFTRDVPQLINASDLFVFPSLPGLESLAGSVLQAMACRKIVVASAIGAIPEYLRDGVNGFLVPPGDAAALRAAIEKALALSPEARERMGEAAEQTVRQGPYTVEAMTHSYVRLIEQLRSPAHATVG